MGGHRYLVASYDTVGNRINFIADPTTFSDMGDVAADSDSIYAAGYRRHAPSPGPELPFVVKFNSVLSAELWRTTLDASATGARARFYGVTVSASHVYVVGEWKLSGGNFQNLAVCLNSTNGDIIWQKIWGGLGNDRLDGVVAHNGRVFTVGSTSSEGSGGSDGILLELNPNDGNIIFQELHGGTLDDSFTGIATSDNNLWIGGWSHSFDTPEGNSVGENDMMLVHYSLFAYDFGGFLPPVNPDGSSLFKAGRVIPLKFSLYLPNGEIASDATVTLSILMISGQVYGTDLEIYPEPSGNSNTDNIFRFDPECGCYIFNLSTKGFSPGYYRARVTLDDVSVHDVFFSLR